MGLRVLPYSISLFALLREIDYSCSSMTAEPLAAVFTPEFQGLRTEWQGVLLEELNILSELANAQAAVDKADSTLDSFSNRTSNAVNENSDGPTRKQLRSALFKDKSLSKFKRPVLGGQLTAMLDWPSILSQCGISALVALAPDADTLTTAGKNAAAAKNDALTKNRNFRDIGMRKQFIDKVNAKRKEAHGGLGKLSFEHPNLPQNFGDLFFYADAPREEEETIDEVKASIEELEAQLVERKALLAKLEQEAEQAAKDEAERKALEMTAGDLEAQAQALLKQAAALKAKIAK